MPEASPSGGEALVVNVWVVSDGDQDEFVQLIEDLFEHMRTLEGYIEGALLKGANPTRFVSYARMRSAHDRQQLLDDDRVMSSLRALGRLAEADLHSYGVLRSFEPG